MNLRSPLWKCLASVALISTVFSGELASAGKTQVMRITYFNLADLGSGVSCAVTTGDIDYDWEDGAPGTCNVDNFAALGTGFFVSPVTGPVEFCGTMDDRLRIVVDGTFLFENLTSGCGTVALREGDCYVLELAYNELTGNAFMTLTWEWEGNSPRIMATGDFVELCPGSQSSLERAFDGVLLDRISTSEDLPDTQ